MYHCNCNCDIQKILINTNTILKNQIYFKAQIPCWELNTVYGVGDQVKCCNETYQCLLANISNCKNKPPNPKYWQLATCATVVKTVPTIATVPAAKQGATK